MEIKKSLFVNIPLEMTSGISEWMIKFNGFSGASGQRDPYKLTPGTRHFMSNHDDVIKRIHFPRYWSFVRGIHRSPVNSHHKGQWRGALMFSLIGVWTNSSVNNRDPGKLRRHPAFYDATVMFIFHFLRYASWYTASWRYFCHESNVAHLYSIY